MAIEMTMPKLSDTMEEGKILRWLKQVGDRVEPGEVVAEVETDKADMELEASDAGVVKEIRAKEGDTAAVGAVIAILARDGEQPAAPGEKPGGGQSGDAEKEGRREPSVSVGRAAGHEERQGKEGQEEAPGEGERRAIVGLAGQAPAAVSATSRQAGAEEPVRASPVARKAAQEAGVNMRRLRGTGPAGRITKRDVEAAAEARQQPATQLPKGRVELSKMRLTIARRMAEAQREVPHFYVTSEIDMGEATRLRSSLREIGAIEEPISVTHLILKAVSVALRRHPRVNASWDDGAIVFSEAINLGIATAVEDGLLVPVLRGCERLSLAEIAAAARKLHQKAEGGRYTSDEMLGATFSVSNMGMLDVDEFTALINPPQAAILAVGSIKKRAVVRDGCLTAASTMRVTLSCDHRVLNGVEGARFLEEVKRLLENPAALLLT